LLISDPLGMKYQWAKKIIIIINRKIYNTHIVKH